MNDLVYGPRRRSSGKSRTAKKQVRLRVFIAGMVAGLILSTTIRAGVTLLWRAEEKVETPVVLEPETPVVAETPEPPAEALMEGRNHSNAASAYAYDIESVKDWMTGGRSGGDKVVFLTFDDGPGTFTRDVMDVLKEKGVPGTFFLLGDRVERIASGNDIWERYIAEGHAVALHSYSHDYSVLYTDREPNVEATLEEWNKTMSLLRERFGEAFSSRIYRFPGGSMSWRNTAEAKEALALHSIFDIDWNAMSGDSEPTTRRPQSADAAWDMIQDNLSRTAHPNTTVLLMHDTKEDTVKYLGELIDRFTEEGYEFGILH